MVNEIESLAAAKYSSIFESRHKIQNKGNAKILTDEEIKSLFKDNIPKQELEKISIEINRMVESKDLSNRRVELRINSEINRIIITVFDKNTNEVVREIPCKELQNLAIYLKEAIGLFYDKQV
jgi:flagellar protein FlaG